MDFSHRKNFAVVRIINKDGKPASNVSVDYRLTNHEFLFGCGAFDVVPYMNIPEEMADKKDFFKKRVDLWLQVFNYGTLPFYWGNFEQEEGKPFTEGLMKSAEFLKSKNVTVKGHPLCWHTVCADWLLKYDNETILKKQLERIEREVVGFKGVVDMWDVINEVVIMPKFDKYDNAITRICNELGQVKLVKTVFDKARECNPNATLLLNDFNTSPAYEDLINRCLDAGVEISAIGIQSHQHQGYWGAEKTYDVLERFSKFNLPIHFTENTLLSGTPVPAYIDDLNDWQVEDWPSLPEYEEIQKNNLDEMLRILFANKNVKAMTMWDFTDGMWLNAPSGVVRRDCSPKPVFEHLKKLVKEEWSTKGTSTTDENGALVIDGFKGEYEIIIDGRAFNFAISDDTKSIDIQL